MNIYLFKMTLKDNNVFYQGIVFFQNKEGGYEMESMMVDKQLENLIYFYAVPPAAPTYA